MHRLGHAALLALALAGCSGERADLPATAARPPTPPAVATGALGREGDRLLESSPTATWVALCRGERGVLVLDEEHALTFETLVSHDESGRWVVLRDGGAARLVDAWARTSAVIPGSGHNFSGDGRLIAYAIDDQVAVRELATGDERRFTGEVPGGHGRLDAAGQFLTITKVIPLDPGERPPAAAGSCAPIRGEETGMMARQQHTIIALDAPGSPRYPVPKGARPVRASLGGGALLSAVDPPRVLRWTPAGIETLLEADTFLDPDDIRASGFVYGATGADGVSMLMRYADGRTQGLAPLSSEDNRPAPDSYLVGAATGIARATAGRFVHLDTGAVLEGDPGTRSAYGDSARALLLGDDAAVLVDAATGATLHRYTLPGARPSLARGSWVLLRDGEGSVVLDLGRAGWVGRAPAPAVAIAIAGQVLIATTPADRVAESTGPFHWQRPEGP